MLERRAEGRLGRRLALAVSLAINIILALVLRVRDQDSGAGFLRTTSGLPMADLNSAAYLISGTTKSTDFPPSVAHTVVFTLSDQPEFEVVALGTSGGPGENEVTSFLVRPSCGDGYIGIDAGVAIGGLQRALETPGVLDDVLPSALANEVDLGKIAFFQGLIKGYCITHIHLDHISGLVIGSQVDVKKHIFGSNETITDLRDSIFNNKAWPNLANEGPDATNTYQYVRLPERSPLSLEPFMADAAQVIKLTVEAHPLSHAGVTSTAFLMKSNAATASNASAAPYILFLGDVGPDSVEQKADRSRPKLSDVWRRVAPLVRQGQLRGIFIECSYLSSRPDDLLFGHLTPKYIVEELRVLASFVNEQDPGTSVATGVGSQLPLTGLNVVVFHIKETNTSTASTMRAMAHGELDELNNLGVRFLVPPSTIKIFL